ncbi:MAG: helix-turn-helix domain-containing protein [Rhodanobacter sp.]
MKNERLLRVRGSLSQMEFAKVLGVHKNTVARYESGVREPDGPYLRALIEKGWNPVWVLTGEGPQQLADLMGHQRDTYTILTHDPSDPEAQAAEQRRDQSIKDWSGTQHGNQAVHDDPGLLARQEMLATALELSFLALRGRTLPPAKHARLVVLIMELLDKGLPESTALHFAEAAAA